MTKREFLNRLTSLYRECNMADSDNPEKNDWMPVRAPWWAGHIDAIMRDMKRDGAIDSEEFQRFYDEL